MDARAILGLVRPFTMLAPVVGVACAAGAASARLGVRYDAAGVALAAVAALLANAASNAWNQAFDAEIDRVNKPTRPIPAGRATVRGAMALGHGCAAAALAVAGVHAARAGHPWFLACLLAGVVATWVYSAPPLRTKRRTFGALATIAIPRGFLVPVAGWAAVAPPSTAEPFALGVVPGLFVLGAATTKDFADVAGDRAGGCRTLPVAFGARRAARLTAPFLALPFLLYPAFSALGLLARPLVAWAALGISLAGLGAVTARMLVVAPESLATERNHPAWRAMYLLMIANQVGVLLVYALA